MNYIGVLVDWGDFREECSVERWFEVCRYMLLEEIWILVINKCNLIFRDGFWGIKNGC